MDAGTEFSMKLTDGKTLTYRIIGINHDDPAGGSELPPFLGHEKWEAFGVGRINWTFF